MIMLEFFMSAGILGVFVTDSLGKPTNVGRAPMTKIDPEPPELRASDIVCPSVVRFAYTGKYAIKVSDRTFLQFADLDGAANKYGGFIGFRDETSAKCRVYQLANLGEFLDQISMLRSTLMIHAHECLDPAQLYIMKRILSDLHQEAMRLPN